MTAMSVLRPEERSWQGVFENLQNRFPTVGPERIAQVLRSFEGHAGSAAAELRNLTSSNIKPPDPDDAEHVATLLSSPAMFKHACKEQFKKFDVNGDGVLEMQEVMDLTAELYFSFGLQTPSEGSIRAFFDATDENNDGVLSEREFRKFFEMFLRYSFFDVVKMRQLVEHGKEKRASREASGQLTRSRSGGSETASGVNALDVPQPPAPQQQRGGASPQPSPSKRRSEVADDRSHAPTRSDGGQAKEEIEDVASSAVFKCLAKHGVSYRRTPEHSDRTDGVVGCGERVQVLEHWIRTPHGWLPVDDHRGHALFERSTPKAKERESRIDRTDRTDRDCDRKEHASDSPITSPTRRSRTGDLVEKPPGKPAKEKRSSKHATFSNAPPSFSPELQPEEEEWRERYDRLKERFPNVPPEQVLDVLRTVSGHAGKAATKLRDL